MWAVVELGDHDFAGGDRGRREDRHVAPTRAEPRSENSQGFRCPLSGGVDHDGERKLARGRSAEVDADHLDGGGVIFAVEELAVHDMATGDLDR